MALKTLATRLLSLRPFLHPPTPSPPPSSPLSAAQSRTLCSPPTKRNPKLTNFSLPSDSDSDSDSENPPPKPAVQPAPPPPYNPFAAPPAADEAADPTNLQEVFAKIRSDGLTNNAVKMFDGLSQDGLTHEALELFSQIKNKGHMPDVVAHTAVIEAYVNAGRAKEAHKVFLRMLASGVLPNAYTYRVLIRGMAGSGDSKMVMEAKGLVGEMVGRGMRPNAGICVAVYEGLCGVGLEGEGREMVEMLKEKGVEPEERLVREVLKGKRGGVYRDLMSVLYG